MRIGTLVCIAATALVCALVSPVSAQKKQNTLPVAPPKFAGTINVDYKDSTPYWPPPLQPPAGAPNVLLVILDDVGFGASSTFGGPVHTPTLDSLAQAGLMYNRFHTTALCSPTRAALLTGRNHHSAHTGSIMECATGYPGYDTLMYKDTATVAEVLRQYGYGTSWIGKNHNVPDWHSSQAGPFDLWPTGLGFEYFYGFVGADSHQWRPNCYEGTKPIEPYVGNPDYHFDFDLADQAIKWLKLQNAMAPTKPFFMYYSPGATHAPHHPRKTYIDMYNGQFDKGWNAVRQETFERQKTKGIIPADAVLTPTPDSIPAWDTLSQDQKGLFAYMMQVYAGYLQQTDENVGRVVQAIKDMGKFNNTLVIYICGDNGASAEGSMQGLYSETSIMNKLAEDFNYLLAHKDDFGTSLTLNHYPVGWAHAMCTPFQWEKQIASHFGGTRNGMVICWPNRITSGNQVRSQFHHVIDVVPTILEATGIQMPTTINGVKQKPVEGVSMVYTFNDPAAASTHRTQYFEIWANRAIYSDGWVACTTPPLPPWAGSPDNVDVVDGYKWELYNVDQDFTQAHDLAAANPSKLQQLQKQFDKEARKYNVYPLDNRRNARMDPSIRPNLTSGRTSFTYYAGMKRLPEASVPDVKNKSWSLTAEVEMTKADDQGMIITQGGRFGGWALYIQNSRPVFYHNVANIYTAEVVGPVLPVGNHVIVFDFAYDYNANTAGAGGDATLLVDGAEVGHTWFNQTTSVRFSFDETLDVGEDTGMPVNLTYDVPYKFTGNIGKVTIDLDLQPAPLPAAAQKKLDQARRDAAILE